MQKKWFTMSASFLLLLLAQTARGDSVQSFKEVEHKEGCASIPYSSLRGSCRSKQEGVDEWCKHERRSCAELGTRGPLEAIEGMSRKVESLKSEKESLGSRKSSATDEGEKRDLENKIAEIERQMYEIVKRSENHKNRVDENKTNIKERVYRGERCRDHRREVQEVFKDATSRAKSESDPEIKAIAQKLLERWERTSVPHELEIESVKKTIEECRARFEGNL